MNPDNPVFSRYVSSFEKLEETKAAYLHRADNILCGYELSTGKIWLDNPMKFAKWLVSRRPDYARSTWRQYQSAVVYYMEENNQIEVANCLREFDSAPCMKKTTRTSATKKKKFPDEALHEISEYLKHRPGGKKPVDILLLTWIDASRITGLRPSEWQYATIKPVNVLQLKNGKNTNGRACGEMRRLHMDRLPARELRTVQFMVAIMNQDIEGMKPGLYQNLDISFYMDDFVGYLMTKGSSGDREADEDAPTYYHQLYTAARNRMRYVCREVWPNEDRHYTLYSARHQFSADYKKGKSGFVKLAALMGQRSSNTATVHYARTMNGRTNHDKIKADPDNMALVNETGAETFNKSEQKRLRIKENESHPAPAPLRSPSM